MTVPFFFSFRKIFMWWVRRLFSKTISSQRCRFWIGRVLFTIWRRVAKHLSLPPPSPLLHPLLFLKLTDGELCYWVLCRFSNDAFNARQKDKCPLAPSTLLFSYFVRRAVVRGGPLFFFASATAGRMYWYESINYRIVNQNRKMFL